MANELAALFETTCIPPPYVVVGHSYGGIIAREFLALQSNNICGMVFIDTNTENSPSLAWDAFNAMTEGVDYYGVCGYETQHKFTAEEWQRIKESAEEDGRTAQTESQLTTAGYAKLGEKQQYAAQVLKEKPVAVIKGQTERDLRKLYAAGLEKGNGTEEQRELVLNLLNHYDEVERKNQREQLRLSSLHRFMECDSGHNVSTFMLVGYVSILTCLWNHRSSSHSQT